MKILFVVPRFHTNQYQIVKTLQEKKHEVIFHVACIGPTEDHSLLRPVRNQQSKLSLLIEKLLGPGGVNKKYYFPSLIKYWKIIKVLKPDIVVIRDPYRLSSLVAAIYSFFAGRNIIFYTQEELFGFRTKKKTIKQKLTIWFFKAAWMTPVLGHEQSKYTKLKYMYHVPLPIAVKPEGEIKKSAWDRCPKILMIGKYHQERKKHLLFVKAISTLSKKYRFKVSIIGECVKEEQVAKFNLIKEAIQNSGVQEIVEINKNIPFDNMRQLYAKHDIYVLPAVNEPYSVSVLEALGFGLPVICTDTCGTQFNVKNGETGFVVKSNSLDDLTRALESLVSDKNRITLMSMNSLQYATTHLSGDVFYEKFSNLVKDRFSLLMN